jgi:hypothetical protein
MTKYYVHYEAPHRTSTGPNQIMCMIHPVEAKSEAEAIKICKAKRPGSFGHWVNRLANEAV